MSITVINAGSPGAHQRIQDWRRTHPDGFLINYRSRNNATLHRSHCPTHFGDTEWEEGRDGWGTLGNSTKLLSNSSFQLVEWARGENITLKPCGSCHP